MFTYGELGATFNSGGFATAHYSSPALLAATLDYVSYQPQATLNDYYQYFIEPSVNLSKSDELETARHKAMDYDEVNQTLSFACFKKLTSYCSVHLQ